MTIGEWLANRKPEPPAELFSTLRGMLGHEVEADASSAAEILLKTAEQRLRQLVAKGETGRAVANDLLAIDALTTYALEAATESLESLGDFADGAMRRLSSTANDDPEPPSHQ
jgi:hypothetical protein